jgi:hypothetical protein
LPTRDANGGDARLEENTRRTGRPGAWVKIYRDQLPVRLNEKYLLAIVTPARLRGSSSRDLYALAWSRKVLDDNSTSGLDVRDPFSIGRKLGFYSLGSERLDLVIARGVDPQGS